MTGAPERGGAKLEATSRVRPSGLVIIPVALGDARISLLSAWWAELAVCFLGLSVRGWCPATEGSTFVGTWWLV